MERDVHERDRAGDTMSNQRHWLEEWMINFWRDKYYEVAQPQRREPPNYSVCSKHLNREDGCPECWPSEQPQRSEPLPPDWNKDLPVITHMTDTSDQWTPEWIKQHIHIVGMKKEVAAAICAAHNAALAAERKKWEVQYRARLRDSWLVQEKAALELLMQQLAAERQRSKSAGILADQFKQMLAVEREERCEVCNSELSQCGAQGIDGEPSLDCLVCKLREQLADEREKHGN